MNEIMWWGYLHQNGSIQVKRWFGDHKDYTEDCEGNDFVQQVVRPFAADTREKAVETITRALSPNDQAQRPASYNPKACCGDDCFAFGSNPAEPCWGNVHVADEVPMGEDDWGWVHECEGHDDCYDGSGKYKPEPQTPNHILANSDTAKPL